MDKEAQKRYADYQPGQVICQECSTRASGLVLYVEDIPEHDAQHRRWAYDESLRELHSDDPRAEKFRS